MIKNNLHHRPSRITITVSFIIMVFFLLTPNGFCEDEPPVGKRDFSRAMQVFNSGNFLIASKRFLDFVKNFPESESATRAKLHIATCQKRAGEFEKAINTYISVLEGHCKKEELKEAAVALGKMNNKIAKEYLENKLSTRDINVRAAVAEALGIIGNNRTAKKMMKALKSEREPDIQEKILSSVARIRGKKMKFKSLIAMFKKGSEDLQINIVKILSLLKKNHVVNFLQNQLETSSTRLKPYIIWALARIDPYEYGVRLEGTIEEENGVWFFTGGKNGKKYKLIKPGINETISEKEFKEFKDKTVILFGGKYQDMLLYTEVYEK